MTKHQAEQVAEALRAAGWPVVYVEMSDDGKWRAVAEDPDVHDGWLMRPCQIQNVGKRQSYLDDRLSGLCLLCCWF